jgi:hypothetical protein
VEGRRQRAGQSGIGVQPVRLEFERLQHESRPARVPIFFDTAGVVKPGGGLALTIRVEARLNEPCYLDFVSWLS